MGGISVELMPLFTYHGAGKRHLYVIKCLKQYWRKSMNYTEKEKEYFNNKLSQVIYNPNRFKVLIGEDRFLFGIVSAGDSEAPFGRLMQYKTLYDTLIDLD